MEGCRLVMMTSMMTSNYAIFLVMGQVFIVYPHMLPGEYHLKVECVTKIKAVLQIELYEDSYEIDQRPLTGRVIILIAKGVYNHLSRSIIFAPMRGCVFDSSENSECFDKNCCPRLQSTKLNLTFFFIFMVSTLEHIFEMKIKCSVMGWPGMA